MSTREDDFSLLINTLLNDKGIKGAAEEMQEIKRSGIEKNPFPCIDPPTGNLIEQFGYPLLMEDLGLDKKDFIAIYEITEFEYKRLKRKLPGHLDKCEYCRKVSRCAEELNQSVIDIFESFVEEKKEKSGKPKQNSYWLCVSAASVLIGLFLLCAFLWGYNKIFEPVHFEDAMQLPHPPGISEVDEYLIPQPTPPPTVKESSRRIGKGREDLANQPSVSITERLKSNQQQPIEVSAPDPRILKSFPEGQSIVAIAPHPKMPGSVQNQTPGNLNAETPLEFKGTISSSYKEKGYRFEVQGLDQIEQKTPTTMNNQPTQYLGLSDGFKIKFPASSYSSENIIDHMKNPEIEAKEKWISGGLNGNKCEDRLALQYSKKYVKHFTPVMPDSKERDYRPSFVAIAPGFRIPKIIQDNTSRNLHPVIYLEVLKSDLPTTSRDFVVAGAERQFRSGLRDTLQLTQIPFQLSGAPLIGHADLSLPFNYGDSIVWASQGSRMVREANLSVQDKKIVRFLSFYVNERWPSHSAINSESKAEFFSSVYFQDKWQPTSRLSLNLGVRVEKEDLPSINFGWGDKIVPRLGATQDVFGNGKWKLSTSYGHFFDTMQLELARGSFGGNYWVSYVYLLNNPNVNLLGKANPGALGNVITEFDNRLVDVDSNGQIAGISPAIKPYQQREFSFSTENQFGTYHIFDARYTRKRLIRAIEDIGILDANESEYYTIGNPGEGLTDESLVTVNGVPLVPKAKRDYDALELRLDGRRVSGFARNLNYSMSYTYSRLYGNYAGLANSDENGRAQPSVSLAFDLPFGNFDSKGQNVYGRLAIDRPHTSKLFTIYTFNNPLGATTLSLTRLAYSGKPLTSQVTFTVPVYYIGRGDLGRTPAFTQTDFAVPHRCRVTEGNYFQYDLNILNLFNEDNILNQVNAFLNDPANPQRRTTAYGLANSFQSGRQVRMSVKYTF